MTDAESTAHNVDKTEQTDQQCKLCRLPRQLRKSHIIPEFMYTSMYDDKHRFHVVSTKRRPAFPPATRAT
jgi:hypothetical protein